MPVLNDGTTPMDPRWRIQMEVLDYMPEGCDGTGHWPGIECPCSPCCLTDGQGGFHVYHNDFTERLYER